MRDQLSVTLEDDELLAEVEMVTSMMIAATAAAGPMSLDEIDAVLQVVAMPSALTAPPRAIR